MSALKKVMLAALASGTMVSGAYAADLTTTVPETTTPAPMMQDSAFDWNRFYVGAFGAAQGYEDQDWEYGAGLAAGVNTQIDFYLLGGEVAISGLTGNGDRTYGQALARAGVVATDEVVLYGTAGYGVDLSAADEEHWLVGGGAEFAVSDNISIDGQYLHGFEVDDTQTPMNQVTIGVNYHF